MIRMFSLSAIAVLAVVLTSCSVLPPFPPEEPVGPTSGDVGVAYSFSAVTTDPTGNPIAYRFCWGDGQMSDWSDFVPSGMPVTMFHSWDSAGTYTVKAQAKDILELRSCWSCEHEITITTRRSYPDSVIAVIRVGGDAQNGVALPGGEHVYVTGGGSNEVYAICTRDNTVVATIRIPGAPTHITCTPNGRFVYVSSHDNYTVSVVRTCDNTVVAVIPVTGDAHGIACLPSGDYVYVANDEPTNTVQVIRTSDNAIVATIPVGSDASGLITSPDGNHVYVTNRGEGTVSVIRTWDNTVESTIRTGGSPHRLAVLPSGDYLYVTMYSDVVKVVRVSDHTIVAEVPMAGPMALMSLPSGDYVYVADQHENNASVIRTRDNTVVAEIPVGYCPFSAFCTPNGRQVYVPSRNGDITVIGYSGESGSLATERHQ